jgi:hypothetical protein
MIDGLRLIKIESAQANAEKELRNAVKATEEGNHGKARTCARRAVGFVVGVWLEENPDARYGKSFMNYLRGIVADEKMPERIKNAAYELIKRPHFDEILGGEAIENANAIIEYFTKLLKAEAKK